MTTALGECLGPVAPTSLNLEDVPMPDGSECP